MLKVSLKGTQWRLKMEDYLLKADGDGWDDDPDTDTDDGDSDTSVD